jgi:hypothetical protein
MDYKVRYPLWYGASRASGAIIRGMSGEEQRTAVLFSQKEACQAFIDKNKLKYYQPTSIEGAGDFLTFLDRIATEGCTHVAIDPSAFGSTLLVVAVLREVVRQASQG